MPFLLVFTLFALLDFVVLFLAAFFLLDVFFFLDVAIAIAAS